VHLFLPGFCVCRCCVCLCNAVIEPGAGSLRGDVKSSAGIALPDQEPGCTEQLARFFPQVAPVRIPVEVIVLRGGRTKLREAATVEFAAPDFAIFLSTLPLEFDDRVRLERDRTGRAAEANVIAVQYHEGRKAVAVKFTQGPCDWVTQP
jgi:hypothetical protein